MGGICSGTRKIRSITWKCGGCNFENPVDWPRCENCAARRPGTLDTATLQLPSLDGWTCLACGSKNPTTTWICTGKNGMCGQSRQYQERHFPSTKQAVQCTVASIPSGGFHQEHIFDDSFVGNSWTCMACRTINSIDANVCVGREGLCGQSKFYSNLFSTKSKKPTLSQTTEANQLSGWCQVSEKIDRSETVKVHPKPGGTRIIYELTPDPPRIHVVHNSAKQEYVRIDAPIHGWLPKFTADNRITLSKFPSAEKDVSHEHVNFWERTVYDTDFFCSDWATFIVRYYSPEIFNNQEGDIIFSIVISYLTDIYKDSDDAQPTFTSRVEHNLASRGFCDIANSLHTIATGFVDRDITVTEAEGKIEGLMDEHCNHPIVLAYLRVAKSSISAIAPRMWKDAGLDDLEKFVAEQNDPELDQMLREMKETLINEPMNKLNLEPME